MTDRGVIWYMNGWHVGQIGYTTFKYPWNNTVYSGLLRWGGRLWLSKGTCWILGTKAFNSVNKCSNKCLCFTTGIQNLHYTLTVLLWDTWKMSSQSCSYLVLDTTEMHLKKTNSMELDLMNASMKYVMHKGFCMCKPQQQICLDFE